MLSRTDSNQYITTVIISLADGKQYKLNSGTISHLIEKLAFPIAHGFTQVIGAMASTINITIMRNISNRAFGYKIVCHLLTDKDLNNDKDESDKVVKDAFNTAIGWFDKSKQLQLAISTIEYKTAANALLKAKYKGKISTKGFRYNQIGGLDQFDTTFVDENDLQVSTVPTKKNFEYDRNGNLTEIRYEYQKTTPVPIDLLHHLDKEIKGYVEDHKDCMPFYNSIKAGDYNQALRRACVAGNLALVKILTKNNSKNELNLNFSQSSINGKTPLDYALESKNQDLVLFLKANRALDSDTVRLLAIETEEIFSAEFNYKPKSTFERLNSDVTGSQSRGSREAFLTPNSFLGINEANSPSRPSEFFHRPSSEPNPKAIVKEVDLSKHVIASRGRQSELNRGKEQKHGSSLLRDIEEIERQNKLSRERLEQQYSMLNAQLQPAPFQQFGVNSLSAMRDTRSPERPLLHLFSQLDTQVIDSLTNGTSRVSGLNFFSSDYQPEPASLFQHGRPGGVGHNPTGSAFQQHKP